MSARVAATAALTATACKEKLANGLWTKVTSVDRSRETAATLWVSLTLVCFHIPGIPSRRLEVMLPSRTHIAAPNPQDCSDNRQPRTLSHSYPHQQLTTSQTKQQCLPLHLQRSLGNNNSSTNTINQHQGQTVQHSVLHQALLTPARQA